MAVKKATKPAKKRATSVVVSVHLPGQLPKDVKLASGSTLADIVKDMNLDGYDISLNGSKESGSTKLSKGDIVRVGVKTKNA